MTPVKEGRKLVLVVGSGSEARTEVARRILSDDNAVFLCEGPPGCPLLRGQSCVLTETTDMTVIMPSTSTGSEVIAGLGACAKASSYVVRPIATGRPSDIDPEAVVGAVRRYFELGDA